MNADNGQMNADEMPNGKPAMDSQVADRVFRACSHALARAAAQGVVPRAELAYPVDTVKEALKVYAADLHRSGQLTEHYRQDLIVAYRALANFRPDEDVELVEAMMVPPEETEDEEPTPERAQLLARFAALVNAQNARRSALEAEFREFLEGL